MEILETYLREMRETRASGGVAETSFYPVLRALLNEIGHKLKPKVRCTIHPKSMGAGLPDGGLFTPDQIPKGADEAPVGTPPSRGAVEAKPVADDIFAVAASEQLAKYLKTYQQVLLTNFRDFVLVTRGDDGKAATLESYSLAAGPDEFWDMTSHSQTAAEIHGERFAEFLMRVMLYPAPLSDPKQLAWFLASYAREARYRVEHRKLPALDALREALEQALGIKFEDEKGEHFFRSTLVQTLFYGVFAAWVLWARGRSNNDKSFDWRLAEHYLQVPIVAALFHEVSAVSKLKALTVDEVLDWAGNVLNRVVPADFFKAFEEEHAVQYFYEPFLQAYDPDLRKQLGVWYTPPEVVTYMVERVDAVLRSELEIPDGLADDRVYVLDPCCGTGSYLVEVLRRVHKTLAQKGEDALTAHAVKQAALKRVFGFEIMPAPFVVAHLQMGLALRGLGAPLGSKGTERAGVFLTNALTGWEPPEEPKQHILALPELEAERDAAAEVKQDKPILVILGNPPYNAFDGVSPEEEGGIVDIYKRGLVSDWGIKKFNLDDLYVRFFRVAERRIVERKPREGIVCFISNFSYLGDPSYVVMRKRFIDEFDRIWIDCLNGDSRETGKRTPEGKPDPSVFSTRYNKAGIRVGTAIGMLVRRAKHSGGGSVNFRHFWGAAKRAALLESLAGANPSPPYRGCAPSEENRYSFRPSKASSQYLSWPKVPELAHQHFNGPVERRGNSLVVFRGERDQLALLRDYLSPKNSDEFVSELAPRFMKSSGEFEATKSRRALIEKAVEYGESKIASYPFKPFDIRLAYLDPSIQPLFSRPSPELLSLRSIPGIRFFITRDTADKQPEGSPFYFSRSVCDYDSISGHARHFPTRLKIEYTKGGAGSSERQTSFVPESTAKIRANASAALRAYLQTLGMPGGDSDARVASTIWLHALAIGYSQSYLTENSDGVRQDWPRIPLPNSKDVLLSSAKLGHEIAALLDTESKVEGVTSGSVRSEIKELAVIAREGGGSLRPEKGELALSAGWGHAGKGGAVMPGKGRIVERDWSDTEEAALAAGATALEMRLADLEQLLGGHTCDIYLNQIAYWRNIPIRVWEYTIGGYQVIKKWLSYRERDLLGRDLFPDEVIEVTNMARRIAAIILMEPELDANYRAVVAQTYPWPTQDS